MGEIFNIEKVTLSWPFLFKARGSKKFPNNPPKYSVVCILEPNSPNHQKVVNALNKVAAESFPNGGCSFPKLDTNTAGKIEVRASASEDQPPGVLDGMKNEILNPGEIYSGVVANVAIDVYATTTYSRVCIGLLGVQKVADGERLDNRTDAKELFAPIKTVETMQPGAPSIGKLLG